MNEIKKEMIIRVGLLGSALFGVAGVAPSSHEGLALAKSAYADGLPEKWLPDMTRLAPTQEIQEQGDYFARLDKGEMVVITSRGVKVLGNSTQVVENDPSAVTVTVAIAGEPIDVPFTTTNTAWVDLVKTSDGSFDGMVKAAVRAGEVKVHETKQSGQCGFESGCGSTRLVVAIAHRDPSNPSLAAYDSVRDSLYVDNQGISKIVALPSAGLVPAQPETAPETQVPEFPKNILEASAIFGGKPESWQQNADGGWLLIALPNDQEVWINPNKRIMEGYNKDGIFVSGGDTSSNVRGATIWNVRGNEETVTELYNKVKQNNPEKQVILIP